VVQYRQPSPKWYQFRSIHTFRRNIKIAIITNQTYYAAIKIKIAPVIHNFWLKHKGKNYESAKSDNELWISGDGQ
jgi:hypothetical protein